MLTRAEIDRIISEVAAQMERERTDGHMADWEARVLSWRTKGRHCFQCGEKMNGPGEVCSDCLAENGE